MTNNYPENGNLYSEIRSTPEWEDAMQQVTTYGKDTEYLKKNAKQAASILVNSKTPGRDLLDFIFKYVDGQVNTNN